ncbi:Nif11-like leader peptide family RiPP precursor [Synechococcus sp. MIT S1220]|uniref:Nif11-like leader peptide family RiPP precursor n=1 Tax=Synechococcus sp. MIT S1220 TaxID=3082549 RepID=UPI0039AF4E13
MSTNSDYEAFLSKLMSSESLSDAIKNSKTQQDIIDVAKSDGFEITLDDLNSEFYQFKESELDDQELQAISGGARRFSFNNFAKALKISPKDLKSFSLENIRGGATKMPCGFQTIPETATITCTLGTYNCGPPC